MTDRATSEAEIFSAASEPVRDDQGRFAAQERQPEPQTQETVPAAEEQPTANLGQLPSDGEQGQGEGQGDQPAIDSQRQPSTVPLSALHEQKERRRKVEADLAARDREMAELRGQMAAFQQMMQRQGQQPAPQPQTPAAPPPDPFEDPAGFARFQAQQEFEARFQPFAEQSRQQQEQFQRVVTGLQRSQAVAQYGAEAAKAAEEAFNTAAARGTLDRHDWAKVNGSDNPYAAAVDWHRQQETLKQVGSDPNKWFETEAERRAKEDPTFQQRMFALFQGQAQQGQQPAAAGQPAAARPPVFAGLPSVNGTAGASARSAPPMSEADIFASAPPKMGGRA